jgi:hypothetical protein
MRRLIGSPLDIPVSGHAAESGVGFVPRKMAPARAVAVPSSFSSFFVSIHNHRKTSKPRQIRIA